jgi:chorismate mutase/GNAT superfamily N-acetyltransferase
VSSTDPVDPEGDVLVRRALPEDAADCAEVVVSSRSAAGTAFPPSRHSPEEDRAFFARRVCDHEVWVAETQGEVVGHLDLDGSWIHSLYVHPRAQRRGVGAALLDLAKACRPDGFGLWVFATNRGARAFYRRQGLLELETTDGSGNEEGAPDVRMVWPGPDPMSFLRHQIDQVDHDLADLVNRRIALTAAVQPLKETPGHAGRDAERERQIAERLAARTPGLDEETWEPIVAALVETGLDVAERRAAEAERGTS